MEYFANKHGFFRKPRRRDYYPAPDCDDYWSPPDYSHDSADTFWARGKRYRHRYTCNTDPFDSNMPFSIWMPFPHGTYRRHHSYAHGGHWTGDRPGSRPDVIYIDRNTYRGRKSARENRPQSRPQPRDHSYERLRPITKPVNDSADEPNIIERAPKSYKQTRFAEPSTTSRARQNRSSSPVGERRPFRDGRSMSGSSTGSGIPERDRMPYSRGPASPRSFVGERQRRPYSETPFSPRTQVDERQRRMYSYVPEPTRTTHRTRPWAPETPDIIRDGYESIFDRAQRVYNMGRYGFGYRE